MKRVKSLTKNMKYEKTIPFDSHVIISNLWTVFANHHVIEKNGNRQWVTELNFYMGDLSGVDFSTDWRFKEVKNRRLQLKFLGTCQTNFPVQYPLRLDNGTIIKEEDYYR